MSLLLSIDTAGTACAVTLSTPDELLAASILEEPRAHAAKLIPLISELFSAAGMDRSDLEAVAVSKGPGSYTGLRIGVSTAKGIAFGFGIPLVGIATFEALAHANLHLANSLGLDRLVTVAPSRRNEIYWQSWVVGDGSLEAATEPASDTFEDFADRLGDTKGTIKVLGEGSGRAVEVLTDADIGAVAPDPPDVEAAVFGVAALAHEALERGEVEDVAEFEPYYLKEFVAKKGGSPFERLPF